MYDNFDEFMAAVDKCVQRMTGLSVYDLPDYGFRDAFDDGESASYTARLALAAAE